MVRTSTFDVSAGGFQIPARTTAVFQAKRPVDEQLLLVIRDVEALVDEGVLNQGNGNALNAKLRAAIASWARGRDNAAVNQLGAFLNQLAAFERTGKLTAEQAGGLRTGVEAAIDCIEQGDAPQSRWAASSARR